MLANILAIVVGLSSLYLLATAFTASDSHRKDDFLWGAVGLFYALVLWLCAQRITGAILLGQAAASILLIAFGWQTLKLRQALFYPDKPVKLFSAVDWLQSRLGKVAPSNPPKTPKPSVKAVKETVTEKIPKTVKETVAPITESLTETVTETIPKTVAPVAENLIETTKTTDTVKPDFSSPETFDDEDFDDFDFEDEEEDESETQRNPVPENATASVTLETVTLTLEVPVEDLPKVEAILEDIAETETPSESSENLPPQS